MPLYDAVHKDTGTTLSVTMIDNYTENAPANNLSSAQLRFTVNGGAVQERTMTVSDAANWIATYKFTFDDLNAGGVGGDRQVQFEVVGTDTNGDEVTTLDPQGLVVRTRFPDAVGKPSTF